MRKIALALAVLAAVVMAAGCGGSSKSSTPPTTPSVTVTVHPTTATTTTTTTATTPTSTGAAALSGDCLKYSAAQAKIAQAVGVAASHGDTSALKAYFAALAGNAPSDIKASFQTVADTVVKYLDQLKALNIQPGQTPNAASLAKASQAAAQLNTPQFKAASTKIEDWVKAGCH
jgi:hypothetical protein